MLKQIDAQRVTAMMFAGAPPEKHNEFLAIVGPWAFSKDEEQEQKQREMLYNLAIWAEKNPLEFAVITSGEEWRWLGQHIVFQVLPIVREWRAKGLLQ